MAAECEQGCNRPTQIDQVYIRISSCFFPLYAFQTIKNKIRNSISVQILQRIASSTKLITVLLSCFVRKCLEREKAEGSVAVENFDRQFRCKRRDCKSRLLV